MITASRDYNADNRPEGPTTYTPECDCCGRTLDLAGTITDAQDRAKSAHWVWADVNELLCSSCQDRHLRIDARHGQQATRDDCRLAA
ncbi:MAG: hypothetical protein LBV00_11935 [Propionibacteriaceae bacterium]|jgi:hypothetical protein|nr:hypothetical protein [Propionibacteriaceae bacterium]